MTKPNVDWFQLQEDGLTHPTTAQQDNMRAVRMQFHGCQANAVDEANGKMPAVETASRLSLGAQAPGVVGDPGTGNPHTHCNCPYGWHAIHKDRHVGVGETIFTPSQINDYQRQAMAALEWARHAMIEVCGVDQRFLEGDTEYSDPDVEDYYLGKAI